MHKTLSTMGVGVHNHFINYLCKDGYNVLTSCENRQRGQGKVTNPHLSMASARSETVPCNTNTYGKVRSLGHT